MCFVHVTDTDLRKFDINVQTANIAGDFYTVR